MIPNANGGLRVGLGVEPTVSNSINWVCGRKNENAYKCLLGVLPRRHLLFTGVSGFEYGGKDSCGLRKTDK